MMTDTINANYTEEDFENELPVSRVFNGKYTIVSPTGEHRTFSIKTQSDDSKFAAGKRVVAILTGPDNQVDYNGFGFLVEDTGLEGEPVVDIKVWRSRRGSPEKPSAFEWYAQMILNLVAEQVTPIDFKAKGYTVEKSCTCIRCNRELTHPTSIKTGIGPICAKGGRDE